MNYTVYDYKGDIINESISQEELDILIQSEQFNCFQYDAGVYEDFLKHEHEDAEKSFRNFRVYKPIVE